MEKTHVSAQIVYDFGPLGSIIRYSNGTARPPARFRKKLSVCESRNGTGRLVKKEPTRTRATYSSPARFTCMKAISSRGHHRRLGPAHVVRRKRPAFRGCRASVDRHGPRAAGHRRSPELLHLARGRQAAERWIANNPYSRAYLEEVSADEGP